MELHSIQAIGPAATFHLTSSHSNMSLIRHRPLRILTQSTRTFTTCAARQSSLQLDKNDPEAFADTVPAYPYGPSRWYKQSNLGLYGNAKIRFGNNVGPKFGVKTRRSWHPNIVRKKLYSRALGRFVQIRISTRVLKTIDKLGGLDEYLLGEKEGRIRELGVSGWFLRWAIMQTPAVRKEFANQREALGLPRDGIPDEVGLIDEAELALSPAEEQLDLEEVEVMKNAEPVTSPEEEPLEAATRRRIKFRVGPKAHMFYAGNGWQRTKPDREIAFKKWIRKQDAGYRHFLDEQTGQAIDRYRELVEREKLSLPEQQSLRSRLMHEVDKMAESIVEAKWQNHALQLTRAKVRKVKRLARKRRNAKRSEILTARRAAAKERSSKTVASKLLKGSSVL
jgi:large subunit ribosomal protein L28